MQYARAVIQDIYINKSTSLVDYSCYTAINVIRIKKTQQCLIIINP
jgi:hypothetical protein